jgi:CBS domain-containing protein
VEAVHNASPFWSPAETTVADLMITHPIKVPTWFTAAAALRVARLKGASHLMVLDRGQLVGSVATRVLASAPGHQPVARSMTASRLCLSPEMPRSSARAVMAAQNVDCLPVVSGALLVGIVRSADFG